MNNEQETKVSINKEVFDLKITNAVIPHIESALGLKLYEHQKNYLLDKGVLPSGRASGKTVAYCIKIALSKGEPLDLRRPEEFSDHSSIRYARQFFSNEFMKIRQMLKDYGLPVREVRK